MFMTAWVFEARHCPTLLNEIKKQNFKSTHHPSWHKHFVVCWAFCRPFQFKQSLSGLQIFLANCYFVAVVQWGLTGRPAFKVFVHVNKLIEVLNMSPVLFVMAGLANWNEPFNWFFSNVSFCISLVMNLSRASTAIDTTPVVALEYNMPFSLPVVRFKICVSIVVTSLSTANFKHQPFKNPYCYYYNY